MKADYLTTCILAGCLLTAPWLANAQDDEQVTTTESRELSPEAMQALERMGAYLRGLTSFSLVANDAVDEVLESGQKIQFLKSVDLRVQRPDRLHAEVVTDRKAREIFYDGKHFTLLAPETRFYTTVEAPPTIGEMLDAVEAKYGIEFPLVDLFYWGQDPEASAAIKEAVKVGTSRLNGQAADHYAFRQDDIDWQIWIAQGEAPLPLRYVITTKTEPGEPRFEANLSWDTSAKAGDAVFSFTPGKDDHPISIVEQQTPVSP